jgi:hypothetical protein
VQRDKVGRYKIKKIKNKKKNKMKTKQFTRVRFVALILFSSNARSLITSSHMDVSDR